MTDQVAKFIDAFADSVTAGTFVKLNLVNYKGPEPHMQKIIVRPVIIRKRRVVAIHSRWDDKETVTNVEIAKCINVIRSSLSSGFRAAHLFTTTADVQLMIGKRNARLSFGRPTFQTPTSTGHDRQKNHIVDRNAYFLKALGITTEVGEVKSSQQSKWRQVNRFVETLADLIDKSALSNGGKVLKVVDMGAGKGYLTFAAYDYLVNVLGLRVNMTGVDQKTNVIKYCNELADALEFENLKFSAASITEFDAAETDILIALHACDTATDDALYKGLLAGAEMIIVAPCCQKEIRRQLKPPKQMENLFRHGTLVEELSVIITDGLRSLILEREGYDVRVFEFVSPEYTAKNNMIAAVKRERPISKSDVTAEISWLMEFYSIRHQHLLDLLT